jgi:Glycerophosphoryl diester phosphodiesterase
MNFRTSLLAMISLLLMAPFAYSQTKGPLIMAHRGGAREFEENTLSAFKTCYENGIRGYETDVRMTKDGVLVILHDDSLDRTHNATGPVEEKTAAELKDVVSKKGGEKFLFLDDLLDFFADKPGVYLELEMKTSNRKLYPDSRIAEFCQKLHQFAEAKKPKDSIYVYTSFDARPLKEIRSLDADAQTLITASRPLSPEYIELAKSLGVNYIGCQLSGTSRTMVREAQKQGFKVNCWPGHSIEDYFYCLGLGCNVHCTDIPMAVMNVARKLQ